MCWKQLKTLGLLGTFFFATLSHAARQPFFSMKFTGVSKSAYTINFFKATGDYEYFDLEVIGPGGVKVENEGDAFDAFALIETTWPRLNRSFKGDFDRPARTAVAAAYIDYLISQEPGNSPQAKRKSFIEKIAKRDQFFLSEKEALHARKIPFHTNKPALTP